MRHRKREMRVRERVRGNIGNNTFTAVEIKSSFSAHIHTHTHSHLQLSPSGWHCVIWHIHFLGWVCLPCCRGSHKPHRGIPANPWMMSLWKHTRWTDLDCGKVSRSQLSHFSTGGDSCHRKFGLISSSLQVPDCWRSLTPFFLSLHHTTALSMVFPFGPPLNYVALHRAMYPKPCPRGHQVYPCQYSVTSALL